jgi:hypothetical protein
MNEAIERLRKELPQGLRARLPAGDDLATWVEVLGPELGEGVAELPSDALEMAVSELVSLGEEGAAVLERAAEAATQKAARKRIRAGLHRLRSRGVEVRPTSKRGAGSVLRPLAAESEQAFVTPIDISGNQCILIARPVRGGTRLLQLVVSDTDGIVRAERLEGRRRDVRRFLDEARASREMATVPVDPSAARALLQRAEREQGDAPARVDPEVVAEALQGDSRDTPGERAREELASRDMPHASADAALLQRLERGAFPPWLPEPEKLQEAALELDQLERSPLVLSPVQKQERQKEALAEAARRLLDAEARERLARRLEETAYLLLQGGDEEGATAAIVTADRVRELDEPLQLGFVRRLLELALDLARKNAKEEDRGKLIVQP